jgi:hypothetical protein
MRAFALALVLVGGCGNQASSGTLRMAASGEAAAVDGYPSSTGVALADGWTMQWDFILVSLDAFYVSHSGVRTSLETDPVIVNLHEALLEDVWTFPALPAQRYEDVGYQILAPVTASRRIGAVTDAQASTMIAGGISYWLRGTAHHPSHHDVVLDLQIPMHTSMTRCTNAIDMTDGLVVTPHGTASLQMTFHLDHVFFDSIVEAEPELRFEAYAAAAGSDFVVTFDELASQPLADLRDIDGTPLLEGGTQIFYDPGSTPLATQDLRSFVYHQATTVGHFNGEGHCTYVCIGESGAPQPSCPPPIGH